MSKISEIRRKEKEYHEKLYKEVSLFTEGTWLQKPVKTVLDTFELVVKHNELLILDIGSGVGRNAIPIAKKLTGSNGKIICVDILETAIFKLMEYSKEYKVEKYIEGIASSIEDFDFSKHKYDFVIGVSTLEHVESISVLNIILHNLSKQTKEGGINCLIFNTSVKEVIKESGLEVEPQFEINLEANEMNLIIDKYYGDWEVIEKNVQHYQFNIDRAGIPVILDTTVLTFVARR